MTLHRFLRSLSAGLVLAGLAVVVAGCSSAAPAATSASPRSTTELSVDAAGVTLHAVATGAESAATTLITVHGGPGMSLQAMSAYDALAGETRRVIAYDQRGSGASTAPADGDYSLAAEVADLEAVRVASGAAQVDLLGESWGGGVALAYTAMHPDRVRALVLVGSMPLDRAAVRAGQLRFRARITQLQAEGLIPDAVPTIADGSCLPAIEASLPAYFSDPRAAAGAAVVLGTCTASTARAAYETLLADDSVEVLATQLADYRGRALVVMGAADAFGTEWVSLIAGQLTGADVQTELIVGAGHLISAERGAELLTRIGAFLAG